MMEVMDSSSKKHRQETAGAGTTKHNCENIMLEKVGIHYEEIKEITWAQFGDGRISLFLDLIQLSLGQHDWEMLTGAVTMKARRDSWRQGASMSGRTFNGRLKYCWRQVSSMSGRTFNGRLKETLGDS